MIILLWRTMLLCYYDGRKIRITTGALCLCIYHLMLIVPDDHTEGSYNHEMGVPLLQRHRTLAKKATYTCAIPSLANISS